MKRAVMSETVNRYPYSFAVRAWSEHFYFLRDEVTVSNFQCVLIAGMEIMEKCVAQNVARLNAKPLRATWGKRCPVETGQYRCYAPLPRNQMVASD